MKKKFYEIYSDASAFHMESSTGKKQGPAIAGVAAYVVLNNKGTELKKDTKVYYANTVQSYELYAVKDALNFIIKQSSREEKLMIAIYTDSQANINQWKNLDNYIKNNWFYEKVYRDKDGNPTQTKLIELETRGTWEAILRYLDEYDITLSFIHVKGHQSKVINKKTNKDVYYNEMCDSMARKYMRQHKQEIEETATLTKQMVLSMRKQYGNESIFDFDKDYNYGKDYIYEDEVDVYTGMIL